MGMDKPTSISAILPTWNRSGYLEKALRSLVGQTLKRDEFEVVVVDDGSTDRTPDVVEQFGEFLNLVSIRQENSGIAVAKNRGIEAARSPIVVFLDDDDVAGPTLLEEHLWSHRRFPDPSVAVLGRTDLSSEVATSPLMRFVTEVGYYLFCYPIVPVNTRLDYTYFWGGRSSCKTELLKKHGCFNPVFRHSPEDIELGYRLSKAGLQVVYNPRALSTMIRAMDFEGFCRRCEVQGENFYLFYEMHPVDEVAAWCGLPGAKERWAKLEGELEGILAKARHLDRIAQLRAAEGLEIDDFLQKELHAAYWGSFEGCKLRGMNRAMRKSCAVKRGNRGMVSDPAPTDPQGSNGPTPLKLFPEQVVARYREVLQREDIAEAFEAIITALYQSELKPGDVAVDGGAHMASHTIPMARTVGRTGRVFAFEPIPELVDCIQKAVISEGMQDQILVRGLALAAHVGEEDFVVATDQMGRLGLSGLKERYYPAGSEVTVRHIKVPVSTLDLEVPQDLKVSFIKLDLEGGELDALRGARRILERDRPTIVFECAGEGSAEKYGYTVQEFFGFFSEVRYQLIDLLGVEFQPGLWRYMGNQMPWYVVGVPQERGWKNILEVIQNAVRVHLPQFRCH